VTTTSLRLADWTTDELDALLSRGAPVVAIVPVGSVEPHGPHLPLGTDAIISDDAATRAVAKLADHGVRALVAPPVGYGVTAFAEGFAGAVSIPAPALTAFLRAVVDGLLATGFAHVALVNNHLEPAHDLAVRAAVEGLPAHRASVACPLARRWARTLSAEFKSGACHAGQYETSLVLAATPALVDDAAGELPALTLSLSRGIQAGLATFRAIGMERAYTGAPGAATADEGHALFERLATMIATEVEEALAGARADEDDAPGDRR
jgi:creatinine amidohydrolase